MNTVARMATLIQSVIYSTKRLIIPAHHTITVFLNINIIYITASYTPISAEKPFLVTVL